MKSLRGPTRFGVLLLWAISSLAGCMVGGSGEAAFDSRRAEAPAAAGYEYPEPAMTESDEMPRGRSEDAGSAGSEPSPEAVPEPAADAAPRLRVFSATLELSVASVDRGRDEIMSLVNEAGGYVESSQADFLVVRVPAAEFDIALERIGSAGDILSRSVETADVTEQFADLEGRLEIARAARERLYELLERTSDSDEQVAILREIRRLTEEIEGIAGSLDSLGRLVEYSRITVWLYSRLTGEDYLLSEIPFPWIAGLNPLSPTIDKARRSFDGELPADFARFSEGRLIRAESADGVRVRLGARENDPEGDAAFWREALIFHRGPLYAAATPFEVGSFLGVSFESRDAEPFVYWVLVAVRERELVVAELFFPSDAVLEEHRRELLGWLEEVLP
jgi:hypothetical protein